MSLEKLKKRKKDISFINDIFPDNLMHGITVCSSIHKGNIISITLPKLPKNHITVMAKDIPGKNKLILFDREMPFLAPNKVNYIGEPIFLIGGPDKEVLTQLAHEVVIEYEEKEPTFTVDSGHDDYSSGIVFSRGNVKKIFKHAYQIIEGEYKTYIPNILYPLSRSVICLWHNENSILVYSPSEYPFFVRNNISTLLTMNEKNIRVIVPDKERGLKGKLIFPALFSGYAALLSYYLKKPVKMTYCQNHDYISNTLKQNHNIIHPNSTTIQHETAIDRNGNITGMKIDISLDSGAYSLITPLILERAALAACGGYACDNIRVRAGHYNTNKVPLESSLSLGETQATYALELHTAKIAEASQIDPFIWKKQNLTKKGGLLPIGQKIKKSDNLFLVLEDVVSRSNYIRKNGAYEACKKRRKNIFSSATPLKGIGLSICFHGIGLLNLHNKKALPCVKVILETNNKLYIFTSLVDPHNVSFLKVLASKILNMPATDIIIEKVDTSSVSCSNPTPGEDNIFIIGKLIDQCCQDISKKITESKENNSYNKTNKSILPIEIIKTYKPPKNNQWSLETLKGDAYSALCWEASVVEIEIDPITLKPCIIGIWSSLDAGKLLTPELYRIQVEADTIRNMGYALIEKQIYIKNHDIHNGIYLFIPGSKDIPSVNINFIEKECSKDSAHTKMLSEQAITGVAPAFLAAVSQAMGYYFNNIPLSPEDIENSLSLHKKHKVIEL